MKRVIFYFIFIMVAALVGYGQDTSAAKQGKEKKAADTVSAAKTIPAPQKAGAKNTSEQAVDSAQGQKTTCDTAVLKESTGTAQQDKTEAQVVDTSGTSGIGVLTIITVPESAQVVFDNEIRGKAPLVLDSIVPGKHTLLLKKKGYFAKKATVNVIGGSKNELTFELVKPVRFSISSEPAGAMVYINREDAGKTPYTDDKMKPGSYEISLNLAGYNMETHTVTVGSGEKDSLHIILKPVSKPPAAPQEADKGKKETEEKKEKKEKSKLSSILDKVALAVFLGFSLIILLIELTQD